MLSFSLKLLQVVLLQVMTPVITERRMGLDAPKNASETSTRFFYNWFIRKLI